jgi:hypothetical protein
MWRTFLDNHFKDIVAIDFFTVPTATFRILFAFIVLRHDRRLPYPSTLPLIQRRNGRRNKLLKLSLSTTRRDS